MLSSSSATAWYVQSRSFGGVLPRDPRRWQGNAAPRGFDASRRHRGGYACRIHGHLRPRDAPLFQRGTHSERGRCVGDPNSRADTLVFEGGSQGVEAEPDGTGRTGSFVAANAGEPADSVLNTEAWQGDVAAPLNPGSCAAAGAAGDRNSPLRDPVVAVPLVAALPEATAISVLRGNGSRPRFVAAQKRVGRPFRAAPPASLPCRNRVVRRSLIAGTSSRVPSESRADHATGSEEVRGGATETARSPNPAALSASASAAVMPPGSRETTAEVRSRLDWSGDSDKGDSGDG